MWGGDGTRHRYSNRWLGREPRRRRRPGARGAGYKAGRGARAGWSCARGQPPCGDRPEPGPAPAHAASGPGAPSQGAGLGRSTPGRAERPHRTACTLGCERELRRRRGAARHLCFHPPPEKFVVRSRMAPLASGSEAGKRLAATLALSPAAAAPRSGLAGRTPHLLLSWAPSVLPAAGNRGWPAPSWHRGAVGWALAEETRVGWGREHQKWLPPGHRQAWCWQGAEQNVPGLRVCLRAPDIRAGRLA